MPATSIAQRRAIAIAEHNPTKSYARNRALVEMAPQAQHDFASTPERGLPQYVGKYAAGGPVAPQAYYQQGGEVDDSMAARPVLPNTPSMNQPQTVGYAKGGLVGPLRVAPPVVPVKGKPKIGVSKPGKVAPKAPKLSRAQRVAKFEDDNGDAEV